MNNTSATMSLSCPFCDQSSFEEKGGNLFCNTCVMFIGVTATVPRLSTAYMLASARKEATRHQEHHYRQQELAAENEWWYGMIFTVFLGTISLTILGVL